MPFTVFTDGSANLPKSMLDGVRLLNCNYMMNDETVIYDGDVDHFDGHAFYDSLRRGTKVKTTLVNIFQFITEFEPLLKDGQDIIYIHELRNQRNI